MTDKKLVKLNEQCAICGDTFEYETLKQNIDKGCIPADDLPDGYFLPDGKWICDECGSCPNCGKSLEKEPEKRATETTETQLCEECKQEADNEVNEITNSIMDNLENYRDMVKDFVKHGVGHWSAEERTDWLNPA